MQSRRIPAALLLGAGLSFLVGIVLWFDNPTVDITASDINGLGPAGETECTIAPWDAGLNDNRDGPGGEHTNVYHDEVAAACYTANTTRFRAAVGSGVLAAVLLIGSLAGGLVLAVRSRRGNTAARNEVAPP